MKEMHKEKTLLCDKCDFATNENYLLKRHIDAVHLKKFACQVGTGTGTGRIAKCRNRGQ